MILIKISSMILIRISYMILIGISELYKLDLFIFIFCNKFDFKFKHFDWILVLNLLALGWFLTWFLTIIEN